MCGRAFLERGAFAKSKNNFLTTKSKEPIGFLNKTLLESLILAQDERWRRA
jgi:hypothetical protein